MLDNTLAKDDCLVRPLEFRRAGMYKRKPIQS